ncbi:MAG: PspA/IM30 family protein [Fibrobacterota bacterium]
MGVFSRLFKVAESKANRAVDAMEKPDEMLEQAIRDQEKKIREVKQSVRSVIAAERETKALLDEEQQNQKMWEEKARQALSMDKEDLARKALMRSEEHEQRAATLSPQWETQKAESQKLKESIRQMQDELSELRRNKDIIIAQYKAAEVKKDIHSARAKIGKNSTSDLIDRMKTKARRSSNEAAAAEEMEEDLSGDDALEKEFESLSKSTASSGVEDKLAKLKQGIS